MVKFGKEVISVHVGQAGVQMGNALWELLCLEHGIEPSGRRTCPAEDSCDTVFGRNPTGNYNPRAIYVDLEPSVIDYGPYYLNGGVDQVRTGAYKGLFNPGWLVSGKEDAGSNFGRGYHSAGGREAAAQVLDKMRSALEASHLPQGFILFHSMGGGTGSGLTTSLLHSIMDSYPKLSTLDFAVFPSPMITSVVVEPYNSVLAVHGTMESANLTFCMDNEALYEICEKKLGLARPNFRNINRIVGQAVSGISAPVRFQTTSKPVDVIELQTNLVPYPRLHFAVMSRAPLEPVSHSTVTDLSAERLIGECLRDESHLARVKSETGRYMACCLLLRGAVEPTHINRVVADIRAGKTIRFVEYSPIGFKVGFCGSRPVAVSGGDMLAGPRAATMVSNTSALTEFWNGLNTQFDSMFRKRAFVHHYIGEGMEESDFQEAREDLQALEQDYVDVTFND